MQKVLWVILCLILSPLDGGLGVEKLKELSNCEVHMTHIPTPGDEAGLRKLGVNLTRDPDFSTKRPFGS